MNPFEILKNLDGMKDKMKDFKESLQEIEVKGASGGNMVVVTMNGQFEVTNITLDPLCVDNRDVPMLEDLIVCAIHCAKENVQEAIKQKFGPLLAEYGAGFSL